MTYIHNINPVMIEILSLKLHWYGFMYALSFLIIDYLIIADSKKKLITLQPGHAEKFTLIIMLFSVIGGRVGYVLFYDFMYYFSNLNEIVKIWQGGMSFHGGLLGALLAAYFYSKKNNYTFFEITDIISYYAPIGLFFGRIGNFINSELYGLKTDGTWGVVFTKVDDSMRHPSMLYEAFLEGIILFMILFFLRKGKTKSGVLTSYFLIFYGIFRSLTEFVRVPDYHIGYLYSNWVTMGHLLSVPMIILGILLISRKFK